MIDDDKKPDESGCEKEGKIIYSIQYLDRGSNLIKSMSWPTAFNLEEARNGTRSEPGVFTVETKLQTSIPADRYRLGFERRDILEADILSNPAITVAVQTTQRTIHSHAILDALAALVP